MNIKVLLFTSCICLLFGCATRGIQTQTGSDAIDVMPVFLSGNARLNCDIACSGSWGASRKTAKGLYEQKLWKDLVMEVARVGHRSNLAYFYLGQAAEGLGNIESARIYYKLGLVSTKCDSPLVNNCDGFVFPKYILDAMNRLPVLVKDELSTPSSKTESSPVRLDASPVLLKNEAIAPSESKDRLSSIREIVQTPNEDADRRVAESKNKGRALIRKATTQERSMIIGAANQNLFDSESARYGSIYVIPNSLACVEVNEKNRFGDYAGFQNIVAKYISGRWFYVDSVRDVSISCLDLIAELHEKAN